MARAIHQRKHRAAWFAVLWAVALAPATAAAEFPPEDTESWAIPTADLYGVDARGEMVWAVGYWGTVLLSSDAGESWSYRPTPTDRTLFAVSFADESHGWAVGAGGTLLGSEDGGFSWRLLPASVVDEFEGERPLDAPLFDVSAISATEAWAVGDFGMILHTRNGSDWEQLRLPEEVYGDDNIPDRIFNAVHFTDPLHGWIAGEFGTTLRTTDGGQSWVGERSLTGAVQDVYLMDLAAGGGGRAVAVGIGGVVIETADGGASWTAAPVPTRAGLFGAALRGLRSLVVGDRGVIFGSRDGGKTWSEPSRPRLFNWLRAAVYAGADRAFVVGEHGVVLRSSDAGESWTVCSEAEPPRPGQPAPAAPADAEVSSPAAARP